MREPFYSTVEDVWRAAKALTVREALPRRSQGASFHTQQEYLDLLAGNVRLTARR
jgi:hypothetical protein